MRITDLIDQLLKTKERYGDADVSLLKPDGGNQEVTVQVFDPNQYLLSHPNSQGAILAAREWYGTGRIPVEVLLMPPPIHEDLSKFRVKTIVVGGEAQDGIALGEPLDSAIGKVLNAFAEG